MGRFIKALIKAHLKYWYMHLATLLVMLFAFFITIIIGQGFDYYYGDSPTFYFLCSITFAVLATPLLLLPNFKAAQSYLKDSTRKKIIALTILNQSFSVFVFYFIGYAAMSLLII